MTEALDLAPLDRRLARLLDATSGANLAPALLRDGEHMADDWRERVQSEGLVRTGAYRDSLTAKVTRTKDRAARVSVRTDVFYARFLEYGTRFMPSHPVGGLTFLRDDDPAIEQMVTAIRAEISRITVD